MLKRKMLFIPLVCALMLGACGTKETLKEVAVEESVKTESIVETEKEEMEAAEEKEVETETEESKVETDEILYDDLNIVISAQELKVDEFGDLYFVTLVTNDTEKSIVVQINEMSINGIMVDGIMSTTISPGKKAYCDATIFSDTLKDAHIDDLEKIETVEISYHICDPESWDTIVDTPLAEANFK